jgi:hypothetical protein
MTHNWESHLTDFDKNVLERLGIDTWNLPTDVNPIVDALNNRTFEPRPLRDDEIDVESNFFGSRSDATFVEAFADIPWFNKKKVSRLATICQMKIYDANDGPDGDGKRKGLRRHWYSWFKTQFAQEFSKQLAANGDKKERSGFDGTQWAGRLSTVYGEIVDDEDVHYHDLWVSDTSRMIEKMWTSLFSNFHAMLCVEKDSLFNDFKDVAKACGIKIVVSGKGKMSKAATELILRRYFDIHWRETFTEESPLYIFTLTDWDFDGEASISKTFAAQARRYTDHVVEARIGIKPEDGIENDGPLFELKMNNSGYVGWATENGLFEISCSLCGHEWIAIGQIGHGNGHDCPECGNDVTFSIQIKSSDPGLTAHGFEVEALPTRAYYGMLVDAILSVIPFKTIVEKLRKECKADTYQAANTLTDKLKKWNPSYRAMMEEFERLEKIKEAFEQHVNDQFTDLSDGHESDWEDLEDDPDTDAFRKHAEKATGYTEAWRPFNRKLRTNELTLHLIRNERETMNELKEMNIVDVFGE